MNHRKINLARILQMAAITYEIFMDSFHSFAISAIQEHLEVCKWQLQIARQTGEDLQLAIYNAEQAVEWVSWAQEEVFAGASMEQKADILRTCYNIIKRFY